MRLQNVTAQCLPPCCLPQVDSICGEDISVNSLCQMVRRNARDPGLHWTLRGAMDLME